MSSLDLIENDYAGQIMLDKSRHLDALLLVEQILADRDPFVRFSDRDGDIFRYGHPFFVI
jgi:hypothetical protein